MSTSMSREERLRLWRLQKEKKNNFPSLDSVKVDVDHTPRKPLGLANTNIPKPTPSKTPKTTDKTTEKEKIVTPVEKSKKQVKSTPKNITTPIPKSKKASPPPQQLPELDNIFSPKTVQALALDDIVSTYNTGGWTPDARSKSTDLKLENQRLASRLVELEQELKDAYACIDVLEKREDWVPKEQLHHEVDQIREALEIEWKERFGQVEMTMVIMEEERDSAIKKRAQLEHALAECIEENEQFDAQIKLLQEQVVSLQQELDTALKRPPPPSPNPVAPRMTNMGPLWQHANRSIAAAKMYRFANSQMYQQMLENNAKYEEALQQIQAELEQEKETNATLMTVQAQMLEGLAAESSFELEDEEVAEDGSEGEIDQPDEA